MLVIEIPPQSPEQNAFAFDCAHQFTVLVGQMLDMQQALNGDSHDFRYAVVHAHLLGIAGAIRACEMFEDAEALFNYFQAFGAGIVADAIHSDELYQSREEAMERHGN